jgi:hypothetical protein|tara:strand:+ start:321 stop:677 length:357 start_codon:yes stop_codon:yes gene_type:complete
MAGKIVADQLEHSTAGSLDTQFVVNGSAKAWAFTTDNVITDSLNTSSSTDNDTGHYTITLASAMGNANFSVTATVNENNNYIVGNRERATTSYGIRVKNTSGTGVDGNTGSAVLGDLA